MNDTEHIQALESLRQKRAHERAQLEFELVILSDAMSRATSEAETLAIREKLQNTKTLLNQLL